MEKEILEYLVKNSEKDYTLLETFLILSINGVFISSNTLISFCESIEKNQQCILSYGLLKHQNDALNNFLKYYLLNLKKIEIIENSNKNNNINNNNNYNNNNNNNINNINNTNYQHSDNFKINLMISLIIENNNNYIGKNNNNINNSSNNNNLQDKNYLLFKKIWGNIIIKNEILFHLRLYNIHLNTILIKNRKQLENYKYRSYLNSIIIRDNDSGDYNEIQFNPSNGKKIINKENDDLNNNNDNDNDNDNDGDSYNDNDDYYEFPNSLTKIEIHLDTNKLKLAESITTIKFGNLFNETLDGGWLPKGLKHIEFGEEFQQPIKKGQLPNSLESIIFDEEYKGEIEVGSITPKSIENGVLILNSRLSSLSSPPPEFHYKFISSQNRKSLLEYRIPNRINSFEFDEYFNQSIMIGDLPSTITACLKFGSRFNSLISVNSLPMFLRVLKFGNAFNVEIGAGVLPPTLEYLEFGDSFNQRLSPNILPISLKTLKLGKSWRGIVDLGKTNLTSIKFQKNANQHYIMDDGSSFPKTLTSLKLGGYYGSGNGSGGGVLNGHMFPESLTYLSIGSRYYDTLDNLYNTNITTLSLRHCFSNPMLPNRLKTLIIKSVRKSSLSASHCLPSTLESIYIINVPPSLSIKTIPQSLKNIYCNNLNYINRIPLNIFLKYFKTFEQKFKF